MATMPEINQRSRVEGMRVIDRELLFRLLAYLQQEKGSVTLGQFNPHRDFQLANSRITSLVLLASAMIFLVGLALNMLTGQPIPVPVTVDASPFANVRVLDADEVLVLSDDTPLVAPLLPGDYSFQFTYGSRTITKSVLVGPDRIPRIRHEFWNREDVEALVGRFLGTGAER